MQKKNFIFEVLVFWNVFYCNYSHVLLMFLQSVRPKFINKGWIRGMSQRWPLMKISFTPILCAYCRTLRYLQKYNIYTKPLDNDNAISFRDKLSLVAECLEFLSLDWRCGLLWKVMCLKKKIIFFSIFVLCEVF